ncbi:MAG: hypothetical protein KF812_03765 [Fimbriimonadaceae bacterium]|nr:hypothetical protein [Fimbriimonadaceae bacterium]
MIAPATGRSPRKPARYLAHCNGLQEWHLLQSKRAASRKGASGKLVLASVFMSLSFLGSGLAVVMSTAKSSVASQQLSKVESQMQALGAGAAEAGVQREYREIVEGSLKHNAGTLNPISIVLNEMPLNCWPETISAAYEQKDFQVTGRASALTTEVKYELVRNIEDQESTLEAKIDSFGLEMREGRQLERFNFVARYKEGAKSE